MSVVPPEEETPGLVLKGQDTDDALVAYEGHVVDSQEGLELYKTFLGSQVIRKVQGLKAQNTSK